MLFRYTTWFLYLISKEKNITSYKTNIPTPYIKSYSRFNPVHSTV